MMFVFGLVLNPLLGVIVIFIGSALALPVSLILLWKKHENLIPFGPFLLIAFAFIYFTHACEVCVTYTPIPLIRLPSLRLQSRKGILSSECPHQRNPCASRGRRHSSQRNDPIWLFLVGISIQPPRIQSALMSSEHLPFSRLSCR